MDWELSRLFGGWSGGLGLILDDRLALILLFGLRHYPTLLICSFA